MWVQTNTNMGYKVHIEWREENADDIDKTDIHRQPRESNGSPSYIRHHHGLPDLHHSRRPIYNTMAFRTFPFFLL
jgi:hypothetical protein